MNPLSRTISNILFLAGMLFCILYISSFSTLAQMPLSSPFGQQNNGQQNPFDLADSTAQQGLKKKKWISPPAIISYRYMDSEVKHSIDTSIFLLHRYFSKDGFYHYLGNYGTSAQNRYFEITNKLGPQMDYKNYHPYRTELEHLPYYNTTRPYSEFIYSLGGKQEQVVSILHTQNINRNWNVAVKVGNISSPGYFQNQHSNYNGGFITSNYTSKNNRFSMHAALNYNNNRSDENGGIIADSLLISNTISDRGLIPTRILNNPSSANRSQILNNYRTIEFLVENKLQWGIADTLYNEDSTAITPRFTPKFAAKHTIKGDFQRHLFEDKFPRYTNYLFIEDSLPFVNADTNRNKQILNTIENKFAVNGFIGKPGHQSKLEVGISNRLDFLKEDVAQFGKSTLYVNNYIFGKIQKEALDKYDWNYGADAAFYFAGSAIGDFNANAFVSKHLKNIGAIKIYFNQNLSQAPVNWSRFTTNYYERTYELNKQSQTKLGAELFIDHIGLNVGARNILIGNYIYLDQNWQVQQYNSVFNVLQLTAKQDLIIGKYHMLNEALIQPKVGNAPINIPLAMIRHISAFEDKIFKNKLIFNAGLEVRYHTGFHTNGYSPYFNQFTYRTDQYIHNVPEFQIFAAFRVKQFRLHGSIDQLQQLVIKKNVQHFQDYPMQDFMFRFGFNWILYN